jgi:putative AdoMet-dependent methyltransferase
VSTRRSVPAWMFDEYQQIGVDFADDEQVQNYDARQHTDVAAERRLVRRLNIGAGDTVIEFGPGTGAFAIAAAEIAGRVVAVDISPAMLRSVQARAAEANRSNVECVHGGFLTYQYQGKAADFVVTQYALHHLPDFWKAVALRGIGGMLNEGGTLFLRDVVYSFEPQEHEARLEAWISAAAGNGKEAFSRAEFEMHVRNEYSTFGWILEGLVQHAGLQVVEAHYHSPTYAEYVCRKRTGSFQAGPKKGS